MVFSFIILKIFIAGVHTIAYAFPKVKIVTSEVDPEVNDRFYIMPGIGMHYLKLLIKKIFNESHCFANV